MRTFSFRPALTLRGRKFKGLRGFSGKPLHPPLTDVPVGAYVLVAVFDVISRIAGNDSTVGRDFFISGTHVIIAGAIVSLGAALTGFWDWWRSTEPGNQARRTANWHMTVMLTVTGIVIAGYTLSWFPCTPSGRTLASTVVPAVRSRTNTSTRAFITSPYARAVAARRMAAKRPA